MRNNLLANPSYLAFIFQKEIDLLYLGKPFLKM